jgi:uncharacterized membrane protein (UPF0127 family)
MKKYLILIVPMLILTACAGAPVSNVKTDSLSYTDGENNSVVMNANLPVKKLAIVSANGEHDFHVEIAADDAQRKIGLMNRTSLDDDKGMLFIFQSSGIVNFWMKNTLIPLDMVFIDSNGYIKHIARNAQPCTTDGCVLYNSKLSVQYVLELKGEITDKLGVKEGDKAAW